MIDHHIYGPWGVNCSNAMEVLDARGVEICEMLPDVGYPDNADGHGNYSRNQAAAYARLISAAPDLLEALEMALPYVRAAERAEGALLGDQLVSAKVRAAITKATGGAA